jgi:hypothetical protein
MTHHKKETRLMKRKDELVNEERGIDTADKRYEVFLGLYQGLNQ